MSDSRFILRSSLLNMAGMALRVALSPLMLVIPRFFAQDVFGAFVFLRSLISSSNQLLGLGLGQGLAWWIPQRQRSEGLAPGAVRGVVVFAMLSGTLGALLLFAVFLVFRDVLPLACRDVPAVFLCICLSSIPGRIGLSTACGAMDGIRRPEYRAFFGQSLVLGLVPVLALTFQFIGVPDALAWGLSGASWLCAGVVLWRLLKFFPRGTGRLRLVPDRDLFSYSFNLSLGRGVASAVVNLDLWLVGFLLGTSDAAVYGVMLMLANGVRVVRRSYEPMLVPVVSGIAPDGRESKLSDVLTYSLHMISTQQLAVAMFLACFYRELLSISGPQYSEFPVVFLVLLSSNLIAGFYTTSSQALFGMGRSGTILKIRIGVLAGAIVLGVPLVKAYGMVGAACTSLAVGVINAVVLFCVHSRVSGGWPYRKLAFVNAAMLLGFIVVSLVGASSLSHAGLLQRVSLFGLLVLGFGTVALIGRKTFVPR